MYVKLENHDDGFYRENLFRKMRYSSTYYFVFVVFSSALTQIISSEGGFVSRDRVVFLREPTDHVVAIGTNLVIPCSVLCDNARCLFVTWTRNGTVVNFDERVVKDAKGSLVLKGARQEDEGYYHCVVISTSYGVFLSRRAILRIARIGELTPDLENVIDTTVGSAVRFQCSTATNALPPPNITWYRDGQIMTNDDCSNGRCIILPNGVLQIPNIPDSDAGVVYGCIVSNIAGTITSRNATLNVTEASNVNEAILKVVRAPEGVTVTRHGQATLECLVQMAENVLWKRIDESPLNSNAYVVGGNLIIPKVESTDEGAYVCIAQNKGRSVSLFANVTVHRPPEIVKAPEETRRFRGESWRLHCYTNSNPVPEITWYKNGERLRSHGRIKMFPNELQPPSILETPSGSIEYVRDLLITSIENGDGGVYQCFAENYLGSSTAAAAMIYQETVELDGPYNLTAVVLANQRELEVTWRLPPIDFRNRSVVFIVHFHESEFGSENTMAVKYDSCNGATCKTTCCSNINLTPYTNYTFWVDALLDYNQTPPKFTRPSERVIVRTGDSAVSAGAPLLLRETTESGTVLLSWRKPSVEPVKGELVEYRVEMKTESGTAGSRELVWWRPPALVPSSTKEYTVRGVDPSSVLYFRVIAATRSGYPTAYPAALFPMLRYHGNRSRLLASDNNNTIADSIVEEAPIVNARGLNCSTISVQWASPTERRKRSDASDSTKWLISAGTPTKDASAALVRADAPYKDSSVILFGLDPDTLYQITVSALKSSGAEGLRAMTLATTPAKAQADGGPPPGAFARIVVPYPMPRCEPAGPGRLRVHWEKPPMRILSVTLRYSLVPTDLNEPLNVSAFVKTVETTAESVVFSDLIPGRVYLIAARAHIEYGYKSVYSPDVNCSIPLSRPDAPVHVEAALLNGSLVVWWMPVSSDSAASGGILSYHVRYATNPAERNGWEEITVAGANTSVILYNQNMSTYFVTVIAENSVGRSAESSVKVVTRDSSVYGGNIGGTIYSSSSSRGETQTGATVVHHVSYKEGIIIGVSIAILCLIASAVVLITRSRRDPHSCFCRFFFINGRSGFKITDSGCNYANQQDGPQVRCVELKEMQTLLPQLMENGESDAKGAGAGSDPLVRSHPPRLRNGDLRCSNGGAGVLSPEYTTPIMDPSGKSPMPIAVISPPNGLLGGGRGCQNPRRGPRRSLTSSLPNLLDTTTMDTDDGPFSPPPPRVEPGVNGVSKNDLSSSTANTGLRASMPPLAQQCC